MELDQEFQLLPYLPRVINREALAGLVIAEQTVEILLCLVQHVVE